MAQLAMTADEGKHPVDKEGTVERHKQLRDQDSRPFSVPWTSNKK